jgi:hypothetical protein
MMLQQKRLTTMFPYFGFLLGDVGLRYCFGCVESVEEGEAVEGLAREIDSSLTIPFF